MRNIKFDVPTKSSVSEENKAILEKIEGGVGFVPNIYATYALSKNALARYTAFANGKTSLNNKEKEVVNLVDTIVAIGEKAITNMLHNVTKVPVDFPEAAPLN